MAGMREREDPNTVSRGLGISFKIFSCFNSPLPTIMRGVYEICRVSLGASSSFTRFNLWLASSVSDSFNSRSPIRP